MSFSFLFVYLVQVIQFQLSRLFIIHHGERIYLEAFLFKGFGCFLVVERWKLAKVDVHRVERIDGDAVVGIRIRPLSRQRGIVDGENLDSLLLGFVRPVHQHLQVAEVAHAAASFRAEGEYGDGAAGNPVGSVVKEYFRLHGQISLSALQRLERESAVGTCFPSFHGTSLFLDSHEFVFKRKLQVEASSVRCHTLGCTSFIRSGRQYSQLPRAAQLPMTPSCCFRFRSPGQSARKVMQRPALSDSLDGCSGVYAWLKAEV